MIDAIAILAYGLMAHIAALAFSLAVGSPVAIAMVCTSIGAAYLFQILEQARATETLGWPQTTLWLLSAGMLALSVIVSLLAAYGGL